VDKEAKGPYADSQKTTATEMMPIYHDLSLWGKPGRKRRTPPSEKLTAEEGLYIYKLSTGARKTRGEGPAVKMGPV